MVRAAADLQLPWSIRLTLDAEVVEAAGRTLRNVHNAKAEITNLVVGIDSEYVKSHYKSTIERLGRFRRRFGMQQVVLDKALDIEPPLATEPVPSHTRPTPSKFVVNEQSEVTLVDWEWATLGPPEWDLTLAVWQFAVNHGEELHLNPRVPAVQEMEVRPGAVTTGRADAIHVVEGAGSASVEPSTAAAAMKIRLFMVSAFCSATLCRGLPVFRLGRTVVVHHSSRTESRQVDPAYVNLLQAS